MSRKFFGTDGIRGLANTPPMDAETALKVGMAAGAHFRKNSHRHRVVIGKDTRLSGYLIEPALTSGFISMGMDVILVGPMPTPAVSMLAKSLRADIGVMISASHNPYYDNGIKFFNGNGDKLSDKVEQKIEKLMESDLSTKLTSPETLGRAKRLDDAQGRYIEHIKNTFPRKLRLDGMKIVIDSANGAAYHLAPKILWELGAEVISMGDEPNGFNINENCGSTHPNALRSRVIEEEADIGIALDGDADRVIICDEKGMLVDGDQLMASLAVSLKEKGELKNNGIVATVMSNLGLEKYLAENDIKLVRANVGDRYVIEQMKKHDYNFGGEQSGHIIFSKHSTTGDGTLAALQALAILAEKQILASEALNLFTPLPQILNNVRYQKTNFDILEQNNVKNAIKLAEDSLGNSGRILIRKSGTEPLIRVMAEGEDRKLIEQAANSIVSAIEESQSA